ncbi:MAG: glycine/sarcosine/betaine reductase component B subunit [Candidatus Avilachnospira sp.]|jgi:sarcosine reductase
MKLTLNKFHVKDIQFAEKSSFEGGVLYIDKAELAEYLLKDSNISSVDFDIARPGESTRIIPIKDVIQPRYKKSGTGQIFPGFVGDVETVGNGETNVLEDCCVATSGKIVAFQEGIIDMSGPGAEFNSFSKMNILVPLIQPIEGLDKHTHEATVRIAGLKTAAYMAKQTLELEPEETQSFEHETILEMGVKYPDLPKVIYVDMVQCQGLMHDTYVYGLNVKGILSTLISPLEVFDGAIVSGNCAAPGHKNATIHHENNPIILDLLKHHGKDICFVGVLLSNESAMLKEKMRAAYYTSNLSRIIGVDGIIASEEGGGNPETDLMLNCKFHEQKGIKTVLVTDEYCGRDGASQGLADVTPEADAVVTNGNGNQFVVLPKMDKIIGDIEAARVITGGNANSIGDDGTLSVEIAAIMGSCCEMGYEHMTTRLR